MVAAAAAVLVTMKALAARPFAATADPIRAHYPLEDVHPGDVFLYNDCYDSHGTISQLPDFSVVVPVFALANAGIRVPTGEIGHLMSQPVTWGVILGLVVGIVVGVVLGLDLTNRAWSAVGDAIVPGVDPSYRPLNRQRPFPPPA